MQRDKVLGRGRRDRVDAAQTATPPAAHGELKAVQLERPAIVRTAQGEQHARAGQWLVTDADGSVRIVSDDVFRLETLRHELLQVILRQRRGKRF